MEQESELRRLEKFVEKILTRFSTLKTEKAQLEQKLLEQDLLIEELRDNISAQATERNEISERVNKIVDQIEEWELNLEIDEEEATNRSSEATDPDEEELLADARESQETKDEEETHVQHPLFSTADSKE